MTLLMPTDVAYVDPRVPGRHPDGYLTPDNLRTYLYENLLDRQYTNVLIHQPAGWERTMTGAQWLPLPDELKAVYRDVLPRCLARRKELKITVYGGMQWYSAWVNEGRNRDPDGVIRADWIDGSNPGHLHGLVNLTVVPWIELGVTGWVFDSGSKVPLEFMTIKPALVHRGIDTVGIEAFKRDVSNNLDFAWASEIQIEMHANLRFLENVANRFNGGQFEEVPDTAQHLSYCWLNHGNVTEANVQTLRELGYRFVVNRRYDDLLEP